MKHHKMVQMFLLINKLKMQLKCKNHINGCNFKADLTESINKSNNIGFTLNNHILRNHELSCNTCLKCKHQCANCKEYISNAVYDEHKASCRKRGGSLVVNNNGGNVRDQGWWVSAKYMFNIINKDTRFYYPCCVIRPIRTPYLIIVAWLFQWLFLSFNKLLFFERLTRVGRFTYWGDKEQDTLFTVFMGIWFSGYIFSIALQVTSLIKFYQASNDKKQHTRFKMCPGVMFLFKIIFWVIPFRLLDLFDVSFCLFHGGGLMNLQRGDHGIVKSYFSINFNNEIYHPMYICFLPFFITYVMFVGKIDRDTNPE